MGTKTSESPLQANSFFSAKKVTSRFFLRIQPKIGLFFDFFLFFLGPDPYFWIRTAIPVKTGLFSPDLVAWRPDSAYFGILIGICGCFNCKHCEL